MNFSRRICSAGGKDGPIGRKDHGYDFLEFKGNNFYGLFEDRTRDHEAVLQWIIWPILCKIKRESRSHLSPAPAHSSGIAAAKLHKLHYELLPHPPYSPDLTPCDFFLLPSMKTWLIRKKLSSNKEFIDETKAYFNEFDESYYLRGFKEMGETLGKVCRPKRKLRWKIKKSFNEKLASSFPTRILTDPPLYIKNKESNFRFLSTFLHSGSHILNKM